MLRFSTGKLIKKLKFDNVKHEVLEGERLRRFQNELLKIAEDIISVCEENNFFYELSGGTCLGAVRENGFIPWDDDIDFNMLEMQFDNFVSCFKNKFGDKYWIHTCHTPDYGLVVNRVRLKGSIARTIQDVENKEAGFFVDIFLVENIPDNILFRNFQGILSLIFGYFLSCRKYYADRKIMLEISKENSELHRSVFFKVLIGFFTSFLSKRKWAEIVHFVNSLSKNNSSEFVSIPSGLNYFKEIYPRNDLLKTVKMDFEGHKWNIPKNYDLYLRTLYGNNYLIPASEEDRENHIYLELKFPE